MSVSYFPLSLVSFFSLRLFLLCQNIIFIYYSSPSSHLLVLDLYLNILNVCHQPFCWNFSSLLLVRKSSSSKLLLKKGLWIQYFLGSSCLKLFFYKPLSWDSWLNHSWFMFAFFGIFLFSVFICSSSKWCSRCLALYAAF